MSDATALPLINAALTRTGNNTISELAGGGAAELIASENYDELVNGLLSAYPWKWATKTAVLNLIATDVDLPWRYVYERPADLLDLRVVEYNGTPISYEVRADRIYVLYGSDAELIAKYIYRPDEVYWPAWFRNAVILALEPLFLRGIGERYQEAADREKVAFRALAIAKSRDGQSATARPIWRSSTLRARWGDMYPSAVTPWWWGR